MESISQEDIWNPNSGTPEVDYEVSDLDDSPAEPPASPLLPTQAPEPAPAPTTAKKRPANDLEEFLSPRNIKKLKTLLSNYDERDIKAAPANNKSNKAAKTSNSIQIHSFPKQVTFFRKFTARKCIAFTVALCEFACELVLDTPFRCPSKFSILCQRLGYQRILDGSLIPDTLPKIMEYVGFYRRMQAILTNQDIFIWDKNLVRKSSLEETFQIPLYNLLNSWKKSLTGPNYLIMVNPDNPSTFLSNNQMTSNIIKSFMASSDHLLVKRSSSLWKDRFKWLPIAHKRVGHTSTHKLVQSGNGSKKN